MKRVQPFYLKLLALIALVLMLPVLLAQVALAQTADESIPDNLKTAAGEHSFLEVSAKGVQIYVCRASTSNNSGFEWVFKAPEADLFNEQGVKVGKHYAGPTWEANDGSKVVGEVKEKADAPGGAAIPWLLLKTKSHAGSGMFSQVSSVQRLNTAGGLAPAATACDQSHLDKESRVPYTASYYFYTTANVTSAMPATGAGGNQTRTAVPTLTLIFSLGLTLTAGLVGLLAMSFYHNKRRHQAIEAKVGDQLHK